MNKKRMTTKLFGLIVIACMLVAAMPVGNVQAEIVTERYVDLTYNESTVGWGTTHFSSIQAAINAASAGDTITVADGTYNKDNQQIDDGDGLIKIRKPLTIKAAEGTTPEINASGISSEIGTPGRSGVFKIYSSTTAFLSGGNVVIEGFKLIGDINTGIAITSPMCIFDNPISITIQDNTFDGSNGMIGGIHYWGTQMGECAGKPNLVENVHILNNNFDSLGASGFHQGFGILLQGLKNEENPVATISGNSFNDFESNSAGEGQPVGPGIGLIIWIDSSKSDQSANAEISSNIFSNVGVSQVVTDTSTGTSEFFIADGGSIQTAINSASDGDTILVGPGEYDEENIVITKGITLQGSGAEQTTIAPSAVTNNSTIVVQNPTGDAKIDGFTFVMQPKPNYGSAVVVSGTTIDVDSATVTISNNLVEGSDDGSKSDYGFYGQNNNAKLVITNNVINKTGDNPFTMENQMGTSIVSNNTVRITNSPDYNPYFSMVYGGRTVSTAQIVEGNTFYLDHDGSGYAEAITFDTAVNSSWAGNTLDTGYFSDIQIKDNFIYTGGAFARGIGLVDLSDDTGEGTITGAIISGNQIIGENITDDETYGITLRGDIQNTVIENNTINNIELGIWFRTGRGENTVCSTGTKIENNQFVNLGKFNAIEGSCNPVVDASPNWWGSVAGPVDGQVVGDATIVPWCSVESCATFLPDANNEIELPDGATTEEVNAAINNAPAGSTVIIPAGTYNNTGGFVLDKPGVTIILKDGVVIQNNSPCFEVFADNTTITSLGGAVCLPSEGDHGIFVQDGVTGLLIENFEIDGTDTGGTSADGIFFAGEVENVWIKDMYIHNLPVNGIKFMEQPSGSVIIQGNLLKDNGDFGVWAPASLDVRYNAWGSYAGPLVGGDGLPAEFDNFTPWTHVDLYLESDRTPNANQVVLDQTITYKVMGNVQQLMGAEFTLKIPEGLEFDEESETCFFDVCVVTKDIVTEDTVEIKVLNFVGFNYTDDSGEEDPSEPVSGEEVELFSVEFTATTAGLAQPMTFDLTTDNFSMHPGYGPSSTILADELVNGTVDVIELPTINSTNLGNDYFQGFEQTFTVTVNNPTTGGIFTDSLLTLSGFVDATLEYLVGINWVPVPLTDGVGSITTDLIANGLGNDYLFRAIFNSPGSRNLDVELFDTEPNPDWSLASFTASDVTVHGSFAVTGFVSMQGRSYTGDVPVTLTMAEALYGPFTENSLNYLVDNVMFTGVPMGTYTFTTNQPRYLNVHEGLNKTFPVNADVDLEALELKGGNAQWEDNVINLADASLVAGAYGSTVDSDANVNFDGKVNIQDLALVGGNYGLTSDVYTDWEPLVKWDGVSKEAVTPVEGVYEISTAAQLAWIADQVSLGHFDTTGIKVRLTNDINLNGHEWTPIGFRNDGGTTSFFPFRGEFDGGGFTIDGLTITSATPVNLSPYFGGLIGQTAYDTSNNKNTEIKNLVMTNVVIDLNAKQGYAAAAVVGYSIDTNFENIEIFGTNNGDYGAAGLTLVLYGDSSHEIVVKNITNHMDITSQPSFLPSGYSWGAYYIAGGIVAQTSAKGSDYVFRFENCENYGDITQYNAYLPGADGKSPLEVGESFSRKLLAGQIVGQFSGGSGINYKVIVVDSVGTGEITGNHLIRFFDGEPTNILQKASFVGKVYISEDTNEDYGYTYADLVDLVIFGNESVYFTNSNPTDLSQFTLQGEESYFKISNKIYQKVGGSNVEILSTDAETVAKLVDWNKLVGPCPTPKVIIMASTK